MGYICDRAHQHHLDIHEAEYSRSTNNGKSGRKEKTIRKQQKINGGKSVAKQFRDGNEDICNKHDDEENRKINQDHLATSCLTPIDDANNNLIVVGGNDTDLDYNFYKYRKEKERARLRRTCSNNATEYHFNKTRSTLQPISKSLETIVGYANNFLVKLGKVAQQYVVISEATSTSTDDSCRKLSTTTRNPSGSDFSSEVATTNKITTAVNKINVSCSGTTSKSQSRKNNAISPQAATTPILVSSTSSSSLSTKICSVKTGNHASTAPSDDDNDVCTRSKSSNIITNNTTTTSTSPSSSHHHNSCGLVKHSLCLYAASSIIIALCYLTTPIVAYDAVHPM